ncbi:DNA breaking-rejoining enzyme [Flammula alnicola]|nr:DNA breaking-rejoining enzyme [Flammula alnicola]
MHRLVLRHGSVPSDPGARVVAGLSNPEPPSSRTHSKPSHRRDSHISPPYLRPHVFAHERLSSWHTIHGNRFYDELSKSFPPELLSKWRNTLEASVELDTRQNYAAGLLRFTQFCDKYSVPETERMPASEQLLSLFLADSAAGRVTAKTASSWLTGLQMWHILNGAEWKATELLKRTKKGVKKLTPTSSHQPEALPVTYEHMLALRHCLDLSNSKDVAIWAATAIAFKTCTRLGELIPKTLSSFLSSKNVSRECPKTRKTLQTGRHTFQFHIPWTKTTGSQGAWLYLLSSDDDIDSVTALEHHLYVNSNIPPHASLFAFETSSGWSYLSKVDVIARCHDIWSSQNLSLPTGHGFRIGGATFLLMCGVDPWIVMKIGRWSSKAFLLYWREVESIFLTFLDERSPTLQKIKQSLAQIASFTS